MTIDRAVHRGTLVADSFLGGCMSEKFVPFKAVLPYQFFNIHGRTWIKADEACLEKHFNAFLLTDAMFSTKKKIIVLTVREFDEAALVKIDANLPFFWTTLEIKRSLLEGSANDN